MKGPVDKRVYRAISIAVVCMLTIMPTGVSGYHNANMQGTLTLLAVYSDGDYIYMQLDNQPTSHPGCSPTYFVIAEDVPANRREAMFARLMTAYVTGEAITIGYDNAGNCAHSYIRVHRVG